MKRSTCKAMLERGWVLQMIVAKHCSTYWEMRWTANIYPTIHNMPEAVMRALLKPYPEWWRK